ncbi:DUF3717 domain-containing protein (plasmid) [Burkholderia thailandensis]|nr:DUF3717 domain-containing protein [Burkholderia thailandensis]MBS2132365.1 DUF3717 domain-containing protein [Burkholderia thailandensis]QRA15170.1 DUF3717 domain-containing protein [Burkholderia thailandensis]
MTAIAIAELESAINYWRNVSPSDENTGLVLCAEARCLADLYGEMIATKHIEANASVLSKAQRAAFDTAQRAIRSAG